MLFMCLLTLQRGVLHKAQALMCGICARIMAGHLQVYFKDFYQINLNLSHPKEREICCCLFFPSMFLKWAIIAVIHSYDMFLELPEGLFC